MARRVQPLDGDGTKLEACAVSRGSGHGLDVLPAVYGQVRQVQGGSLDFRNGLWLVSCRLTRLEEGGRLSQGGGGRESQAHQLPVASRMVPVAVIWNLAFFGSVPIDSGRGAEISLVGVDDALELDLAGADGLLQHGGHPAESIVSLRPRSASRGGGLTRPGSPDRLPRPPWTCRRLPGRHSCHSSPPLTAVSDDERARERENGTREEAPRLGTHTWESIGYACCGRRPAEVLCFLVSRRVGSPGLTRPGMNDSPGPSAPPAERNTPTTLVIVPRVCLPNVCLKLMRFIEIATIS